MNNKLVKKLRKFVKSTMAKDAQWCVYDTKVVERPTFTGRYNLDGNPELINVRTDVKSLVKGCGKQRLKEMKKLYHVSSRGGIA